MTFKKVEPKTLYFAVTEGQFLGLFFCLGKKGTMAQFLSSYYAGPAKIDLINKSSFDWPEEIGEFDDLPDVEWASEMQKMGPYASKFLQPDITHQMISYIFETSEKLS